MADESFDADLRAWLVRVEDLRTEAERLHAAGELTDDHRAMLAEVWDEVCDLARTLDPANAALVASVVEVVNAERFE